MVVYKIGIIGLGSIGIRHLKNIVVVLNKREMTYTIDLIRSGNGKELNKEIDQHVNQIFYHYDDVPDNYDILFITNPTNLHYDTVKQFAEKTKHMFIEKPVFDRVEVCLNEFNFKKDSIHYVACPLRYTNVIQYLKNQLRSIKVFSVRVICSSYLPAWRPNQDYRKSYSAHKDQGGGVSIDLIHEWDYVCYLFGQPKKVFNLKGTFSNLEIDSDDISLYIGKYDNMMVEVHLDYFGCETIREIQIFSEKDTIVGDLTNNEVRYLKSGEIISFKEDRNDFQQKEISHFFDIIEGKVANDNDISMAVRTLKIAKEGK